MNVDSNGGPPGLSFWISFRTEGSKLKAEPWKTAIMDAEKQQQRQTTCERRESLSNSDLNVVKRDDHSIDLQCHRICDALDLLA